jgi:nicotinate-nucleotide--dimethylbenzimidazole phosphoribosyltransferase
MTRPFDDFAALIAALPGPDEEARCAAPAGFGRLSGLAGWLAAWQGRTPRVQRPILALYAAAHTGADEAEGAARQRLEALAAGEGPVGRAARSFGAGVEVFDLAVDRPVPDAALAPTMSDRECAATFAFGMEALAKTPDLLLLGDVAAGSARAAGALALALFGGAAADWAGEDAAWAERAAARTGAADPLGKLCALGGREAAAIAGAVVAARTQKVPVVLDGPMACAAAATLQALAPDALDHCQVASGPARLIERIGKAPLMELGLTRGDGLAALPVIGLMRAACALQGGD